MESPRKKLKTGHETSDSPNQSSTDADTVILSSFDKNFEIENFVDEFESSSSSDNKSETNAVDEHQHDHHLQSSNVERMEHSPSSAMLLKYEELIREHRDDELNELKRIIDSCKEELLSNKNCIKQLTVENDNLKEVIALRAAQNDEKDIIIIEYQKRIDSVSQLNNFNSNDFNEDCLLKIFSYLSFDDMMQVKNVCTKWRELSQEWFKNVQTLVYYGDGNVRVELYGKYFKSKIHEKTGFCSLIVLNSILQSYGHHIKYFKAIYDIDETTPTDQHEKFIFQSLPKLCKNIVDIDIHVGDNYSTLLMNFEIMATNWEKLEKIKIQNLPRSVDKNFLKLLANNKQLKIVSIAFESHFDNFESLIDIKLFSYLPTTIEKITIKDILFDNKRELSYFKSAIKKFTSLQSLEFIELHNFKDTLAAAITSLKSLTHLSLYSVYHVESCWALNQIRKIKNLKSLNLVNVYGLHEDNVINIAENCKQLKSLRISDNNQTTNLTDRALVAIAKLKKLKYLDIDMQNITNRAMINLCDGLEILRCHILKINNSDAIRMFKRLKNLRYVDFAYCDNLTEDIIQRTNEIANERKNNVLYVTADFSCTDFGDIDTPYFKYFADRDKMPWEIFPDDIRDDIKERFK